MKTFVALILFAVVAGRSAGQGINPLDVIFANQGEFSISFGSSNEVMSGAALLPDGRIICAGSAELNTDGVHVAMLHPDGTLDDTFGDSGIIQLPESVKSMNHPVNAFTAPDGDVIVVTGGWMGSPSTEYANAWKFGPDGTLDSDYGINGMVTIPEFSLFWWFMRPTADEDGRVYIPGEHYDHPLEAPGLAVIEPDGTVDFDFALEARLLLKGEFAWVSWRMVRLMDDGWILFGTAESESDPPQYRMVRALADGTVDESFGIDGLLQSETGFGDVIGLSDGSLLLTQGSSLGDIKRLTAQGDPDITFGSAGVVDLPGEFGYYRLHRHWDGTLSAWGTRMEPGDPVHQYFFSRLDEAGYPMNDQMDYPDGVIDRFLYPPSFGQLVNQPDGKILLSGRSPINAVPGVKAYLARIDPSLTVGIASPELSPVSARVYPNPCQSGDAIILQLQDVPVHAIQTVKLYSLASGAREEVHAFAGPSGADPKWILPECASGVYLLEVITGKAIYQSRVVVMNE
ncbi:MAG: hypothetical protein ACK5XV_10090 [Flavobacteriales bacterium]